MNILTLYYIMVYSKIISLNVAMFPKISLYYILSLHLFMLSLINKLFSKKKIYILYYYFFSYIHVFSNVHSILKYNKKVTIFNKYNESHINRMTILYYNRKK